MGDRKSVSVHDTLIAVRQLPLPRSAPKSTEEMLTNRQPMVTATGIILGFILNFAATWVKQDTPSGDGLAYMIAICLLSGALLLIICLFRILYMNYPRNKAEQYYRRTLILFIIGLCLAFGGAFVDMFMHFMSD